MTSSSRVTSSLPKKAVFKHLCSISIILTVFGTCHGQQIVQTTSGRMQGVEEDGVVSFEGIRYGLAPVNELRWEPPTPYIVDDNVTNVTNATTFGDTCVQQFYPFSAAETSKQLWNDPQDPPVESEDCLFLNVWAPSTALVGDPQNKTTDELKAVVVWFYGGSLIFGSSSISMYNGASLAKNQDIIVITINYRTNIFGFPASPDLPLEKNNLGYLDQEQALDWVTRNARGFGGDEARVTIMGQSAGAESVSSALGRHRTDLPYRAAVLLSGATVDLSPLTVPSSDPNVTYVNFNNFATAMNCTAEPGQERLECLRAASADTIKAYTNGNGTGTGSFGNPVVDNTTYFSNVLSRVQENMTSPVPILIGHTEDDGTIFSVSETNLTQFLISSLPISGELVANWQNGEEDLVRSLYPNSTDAEVMAKTFRDVVFTCGSGLWASGYVEDVSIKNVYRYVYGAQFADFQPFPGAGAWHTSELPYLFGTYNSSTATTDEVTWSRTFQSAIGSFIRNPEGGPASTWPEYLPTEEKTVAKLAYSGNVDPDNFVELESHEVVDGPCEKYWNQFLDF
ncbi:alpha/beta-hydrolase [Dendrothele bispora CBS 962.96]|uniref:Carboxylic ester hydrolase n=1 Tax=Dendrothele bispora (strain CBS 962.96) TaxID=1314807 RepID=A0A4S8MN06_DENBC|nr:alpha/beta-hydrolase [Dendrothele bispora CBS 962.96]